MTTQHQLEADIRAILDQGHDPTVYRTGLAWKRGVSVDVVDAAIAAVAGVKRAVHPEDLAQERIAADRLEAKRHSQEWREFNHLE